MQKLPEALKMPFVQSLMPAPSKWKTVDVHLKPPNSPIKPPSLHPGVTFIQKDGNCSETPGLTFDCPLTGFGFFFYWPSRTSNKLRAMLLPRKCGSLGIGGILILSRCRRTVINFNWRCCFQGNWDSNVTGY
ncbi:hypothetical protein CEXT_37571 [Caerostris extrusa]|uniref:Uncharacterized protein n=1 Tax=Caerostris extrusa TaxID=172846 RepID=A0AAV4WE55_CAEEX|nr:hypothetical protein CEXT_37571 [Caerostris extrusa]